jgi:hypothetical protein
MRYTMRRDNSAPLRWVIRQSRRIVGSVRRAENGTDFVGRIGQHTAIGPDPTTAFREVAARGLGFANLAALRASNARARSQNRINRARVRSELLRGDRPATVTGHGPVPGEPYAE